MSKTLKRLLSMAVALVMVLSMFPAGVFHNHAHAAAGDEVYFDFGTPDGATTSVHPTAVLTKGDKIGNYYAYVYVEGTNTLTYVSEATTGQYATLLAYYGHASSTNSQLNNTSIAVRGSGQGVYALRLEGFPSGKELSYTLELDLASNQCKKIEFYVLPGNTAATATFSYLEDDLVVTAGDGTTAATSATCSVNLSNTDVYDPDGGGTGSIILVIKTVGTGWKGYVNSATFVELDSGCPHENTTPATCTVGETCNDCNAVLSDVADHTWYYPNEYATQTCEICGATKGTAVCRIGDIYYPSLQNAVYAVQDGETITVTVTHTVSTEVNDEGYGLVIDAYKDITFQVGGKAVTFDTPKGIYINTSSTEDGAEGKEVMLSNSTEGFKAGENCQELIVIASDEGATARTKVITSVLGVESGYANGKSIIVKDAELILRNSTKVINNNGGYNVWAEGSAEVEVNYAGVTMTVTGEGENIHAEEGATVKVTAGTFSHEVPDAQMPAGYICTANDAGTYTVAACEHANEVTDAAKDATCTGTGLTEGSHCEDCGKVIVAQEATAKLDHEYDENNVCVNGCGQTKCENEGHTEVIDEAVAATCTTAGKTEGKHCSVCDEVLVAQTEVNALGHDYDAEGNCLNNCGTTKCENEGHTEVIDEAVAATCTTAGKTEGKHCSVCDEVLVAQTEVNALGHAITYTPNNDKKTHIVGCANGCGLSSSVDCPDMNGDKICDFCEQELMDPVASVNGVEYATLAEAWQNADGKTVTLLANVEATSLLKVTDGQTITLDLNGHTITAEDGREYIVSVEVGGKLTINDATSEGGIVNNNTQGYAIVNYGELTVNGGNIVGDYALYNGSYSSADCTATLNGGTFSTNSENAFYSIANCANLIVDGATVNDWLSTSAQFTMNSGSVENLYAGTADKTVASGTATAINGGTVTALHVADVTENPVTKAEAATIGAVSDGYKWVDGTLTAISYVAQVGETKYETLQDAVNVGGTVTLLANVETDAAIEVSKTVVLELNGHSVSTTQNDTEGNGVFWVKAGGDLTINGEGTVNGVGGNPYNIAIWADGGKVTINGGTYTNVGATDSTGDTHFDLIYVKNGGEVVINGGKFEAENPAWTLNSHDTLTGTIKVYGGEFKGFDPANNAAEGTGTNFMADQSKHTKLVDGYYSICEGEEDAGTVTTEPTLNSTGVKTYKCTVCSKVLRTETVPMLTGAVAEVNGTKYGTLQAAIDAAVAANGGIVKVLGNITVNETVVVAQPTNQMVWLNLNSYTVTGEGDADPVIKNDGFMMITSGTIKSTVTGGTVIENTNMLTTFTGLTVEAGSDGHAVESTGSQCAISGTFIGKISIENHDSTSFGAPIFGGTFSEAPAAEYIGADKAAVLNADGMYELVDAVAKIGDVGYATLQAAIDAANAGDTIVLLADITTDAAVKVNKNVTIDLGEYNITRTTENSSAPAILVTGANATITGTTGTVTAYGPAVWAYSGNVTIEGGNYVGGHHAVYASGTSAVVIEGGKFSISEEDQYPYVLNILDADRATCSITVTGGEFVDFNPYKNGAEGKNTNFLADGLHASADAEGVYTVHECVTNTVTENEVAADYNNEGSYDEVVYCSVCGEELSRETVTVPVKEGAEAAIGNTKYGTLEEALAVGGNVTLLKDVTVDSAIVVDKAVVLDLAGYSVSTTQNDKSGDGVFHVVSGGDLTINGEGTVNGVGGNPYNIAIWADGGKVTINGGTYTNVGATDSTGDTHFDLIYVKNGGEVVINGGKFEAENPAWTLNSHDTKVGTITVYGGTFVGFNPEDNAAEGANTDFTADGYIGVYDAATGSYTVREGKWVAQIGQTKYESLQEAVNVGGEVTLLADIATDAAIEVSKTVVLNLNGYSVSTTENDKSGDGVFHVVSGGDLTINGEGTVNGVGGNDYNIAIWADGGKVTINGGTYTNVGATDSTGDTHFDLIYVKNGGEVVINGGKFEAENPAWTLNSHDTKVGTITVYGGTFVGFNPMDNAAEGANTNFMAVGYHAVASGDSYVAEKHTLTHVEAVEADCVTDGNSEYWACDECGRYYADAEGAAEIEEDSWVIEALGHTEGEAVVENEVAADCTNTGSYDNVVYCTVCGDELSRETVTVPASGHTEGEAVVENEVAADCTTDGSYDEVVYCSVCGDELSRETVTVPASGHSHEAVVTAPTCTEKGYTTYTCACGDSYVDDYVDAKGHSFTNYVYNGNATTTADGTETAACDNGCGTTDTRVAEGTKLEAGKVAYIGDVFYESVQDAIDDAAEGETVYVNANTSEKNLNVYEGVTLDLNGYTLTVTKQVTAYGEIKGDGLLAASQDKVKLYGQSTNAVPVWNGEGYIFGQILKLNAAVIDGQFWMVPQFDEETTNVLKNGVANAGITVRVKFTWVEDGKVYYMYHDMSEANIKRIYTSNYAWAPNLTLGEAETYDQLTYTLQVVSTSGAIYESDAVPHT